MREAIRRRRILEAHGLWGSPFVVQSAFWQRYNRTARNRWSTALLGDLVGRLMGDGALQTSRMLHQATHAFMESLPEEYRGVVRVESLESGRLRVIVDSASTRFVLGRQTGSRLAESVNRRLGRAVVRRIEYRLGTVDAAAG